MKRILLIVVLIVALGAAVYGFKHWSSATPSVAGKDYKNSTYQIDGQRVTLVDGVAHFTAGDDSAPQATAKIFGNEVAADLNNDGMTDEVFILTEDNGGSGTFYYAVAALKTADGYQGTNGIFLGDRIAPQTTEFRNGLVVVNYADRKPGQPFSTSPSVGVSKYLKVIGNTLVEVSQ